MNILISLFILRFMRLSCTPRRARSIIPTLQTGYSAHVLPLSLVTWGRGRRGTREAS